MKSGISFDFDKVSSFYIIPTIYIMPNLLIFNHKIQDWDREHRALSINFAFLMFEIGINITHKVRKGKKHENR